MTISELKHDIPDVAGVYFFLGAPKPGGSDRARGEILYIGRATSLRDRIMSYFKDDVIQTRGPLIVDMVAKAHHVEWIRADSVLEAVILEANEIKKYQPHYNTKEKDDKSFNYVIFTDEDFPTIELVRGKELEVYKATDKYPFKIKYLFGPYPHGLVLREALKIIRKIFPYRGPDCVPCERQRASASDLRLSAGCKPCFSRQVGLCPGVCMGEISKEEYRKRIRNIKTFFEGRKHDLVKKLEREMKGAAKNQEFEKAAELRNTLFKLTHIKDVTLIKTEEKNFASVPRLRQGFGGQAHMFRIEGYDIAHMAGQNMGGVMVVYEDGHIKKSDYRLFKIRRVRGVDDTAALREVLDRRLNHSEWTFPNIIVIDGGVAQKNSAESVLAQRGFDIPVVSVVKDIRHKPREILGEASTIEKYKKEILLVNSEAHRFAIKYHRKRAGKIFT